MSRTQFKEDLKFEDIRNSFANSYTFKIIFSLYRVSGNKVL